MVSGQMAHLSFSNRVLSFIRPRGWLFTFYISQHHLQADVTMWRCFSQWAASRDKMCIFESHCNKKATCFPFPFLHSLGQDVNAVQVSQLWPCGERHPRGCQSKKLEPESLDDFIEQSCLPTLDCPPTSGLRERSQLLSCWSHCNCVTAA